MAKYRFKTKEEFIKTDGWNYSSNRPSGWVSNMLKYLGTDVPDKHNSSCDSHINIYVHFPDVDESWTFYKDNYILKSSDTNTNSDFGSFIKVKKVEI